MNYKDKDSNRYTINDLIVLRNVLKDSCPVNGDEYEFDFQAIVMDSLREKQKKKNGIIDYHDVREAIEHWVSSEVGGPADSPFSPGGQWKSEETKNYLIRKILLFIFDDPLASVPLRINDKALKVLVTWRLKIGK